MPGSKSDALMPVNEERKVRDLDKESNGEEEEERSVKDFHGKRCRHGDGSTVSRTEKLEKLIRDGKHFINKKTKAKKEVPCVAEQTVHESKRIVFNCQNEELDFSQHSEDSTCRRTSRRFERQIEATRPISSQVKKPPDAEIEASHSLLALKLQSLKRQWFSMRFVVAFLILAFVTYCPVFPNLLAGFLWACLLHFYLLSSSSRAALPDDLIRSAKDDEAFDLCEEGPAFRGWINRLRLPYDPAAYHVRQTECVLAVLHGNILRLLTPKSYVVKHSSCLETGGEPSFSRQDMYDLRGAKVSLRPQRLARRRWWSRKYPICIQLNSVYNKVKQEQWPKTSRKESFLRELDLQQPLVTRTTSLDSLELPVKDAKESPKQLYLFARTGREKEEWFFRLAMATGMATFDTAGSCCKYSVSDTESGEADDSFRFAWLFLYKIQTQYERYDSRFAFNMTDNLAERISMNLLDLMERCASPSLAKDFVSIPGHVSWVNSLIARTFFDFATDRKWIDHVEGKIQRKLATLRLPWFLDGLRLVALKPGARSPSIERIHEPVVNAWGLWVDFDINYSGGLSLELETKVNLMKLKSSGIEGPFRLERGLSHYSNDELPESPESSDDEDAISLFKQKKSPEKSINLQTALKSFVGKVSHTKHFQDATDNKFIKKIMHGVSDTPLVLVVEVPQLRGRLAVNFPKPPSDRIWYGFRSRPSASFRAVPKVGPVTVNIPHVTDWIEKKLKNVLDKGLVIPNMDDVIVPFRSFDNQFSRYNM